MNNTRTLDHAAKIEAVREWQMFATQSDPSPSRDRYLDLFNDYILELSFRDGVYAPYMGTHDRTATLRDLVSTIDTLLDELVSLSNDDGTLPPKAQALCTFLFSIAVDLTVLANMEQRGPWMRPAKKAERPTITVQEFFEFLEDYMQHTKTNKVCLNDRTTLDRFKLTKLKLAEMHRLLNRISLIMCRTENGCTTYRMRQIRHSA
jgi:hypothetical protein